MHDSDAGQQSAVDPCRCIVHHASLNSTLTAAANSTSGTRLASSRTGHYDFFAGWADFSARTGRAMEWIQQPLVVYTVILVGFVLSMVVMAQVAGPRKKTLVKQMPYE